MVRPFRFLRLILIFLLLVVVAVLARHLWLPWVAQALVRDDGPAKADVVVVLAGDFTGARILKGASLIRVGDAPSVIVDGPAGFFGVHECDLAIDYAVREGNPRDWFIPLPMKALSTKEEAVVVMDELVRRHSGSFLLVTSSYHTARAARIFGAEQRKRGTAVGMRVVAAPDRYFQPESWWRNREGQKTVFIEWSKTLAEVLGI